MSATSAPNRHNILGEHILISKSIVKRLLYWLLEPLAVHILISSLNMAVSSPKCKKCSVMLLKVERIRCKQLSGALEAERFARPSV